MTTRTIAPTINPLGLSEIRKDVPILLLGATGTMGPEIVVRLLEAGFTVIAQARDDVDAAGVRRIDTARKLIEGKLTTRTWRSDIPQGTMDDALRRLSYMAGLDAGVIATCTELIIETISEPKARKQELYEAIGPMIPETAIFATNTSARDLDWLASLLPESVRPRFVSFHYMNPPTQMHGGEVGAHQTTSAKTLIRMVAFAIQQNIKVSIIQNSRAFVVNYILFLMINAAYRLRRKGIILKLDFIAEQIVQATSEEARQDIDQLMMDCAGHPMGPFALARTVGLAVCVEIMRSMEEEEPVIPTGPDPDLLAEYEAERSALAAAA